MNAILLAAGFGKRLRPLTENKAKPAVPILGVPMLAYPMYQLSVFCSETGVAIERLVVNLHYQPMSVCRLLFDFFGIDNALFSSPFFKFSKEDLFVIPASQFTRHTDFAKSLVLSFEHPKILDSAGGLKQAESFLCSGSDTKFLVVNADSLFFCRPKVYSDFYKSSHGDFGAKFLCSPFVYDHKLFGALWTDGSGAQADSKIVHFGKLTDDLKTTLEKKSPLVPMHNIGFYFVSQTLATTLPEGESKIFDALSKYSLSSHCFLDKDALWFETGDINTFKNLSIDLEKHYNTSGDWLGDQLSHAIDFWNN